MWPLINDLMDMERIVYVVRAVDCKDFVFVATQVVTEFVKKVRCFKKIVILFPVKVDTHQKQPQRHTRIRRKYQTIRW